MKKSEAVMLVRKIGWVVQKTRSNIREATEQVATKTSADPEIAATIDEDLFPHLFGRVGDKWVEAILRMVDKGDTLEPQEFYNLCFIVHQLEPILETMADICGIKVPQPSLILMHWDPE